MLTTELGRADPWLIPYGPRFSALCSRSEYKDSLEFCPLIQFSEPPKQHPLLECSVTVSIYVLDRRPTKNLIRRVAYPESLLQFPW